VLIGLLLAGLFFLPRTGVALLMALIVAIAGFEWARLCGLGVMESRVYAAAIVIGLLVLVSVEVWRPAFLAAAAFWVFAAPAWLWLGVSARQRNGLMPLGFLVLVPAALAMVALEPRDALLALDHAVDGQIELEALVHTFSSGAGSAFELKHRDGIGAAHSALGSGQTALQELGHRRRGLLVSLGFVLLVLVGLALKIRELSARGPEA